MLPRTSPAYLLASLFKRISGNSLYSSPSLPMEKWRIKGSGDSQTAAPPENRRPPLLPVLQTVESAVGRSSNVPRRWAGQAWRLAASPLLLFFLIPILALLANTTLARLISSLGDVQLVLAVLTSLRTTLVSLVITILFGIPLAYLVGRHQFRFKSSIEALIELPTVMPPAVAGLALLMTFGRRGILGDTLTAWGLQIPFTPLAVVMAQVFVSAPFFVRTASLGFASVDRELEQAAQLDGANRWQVFRFVILPLSYHALTSGGALSWSRALGEFGATIMFAGNFPGRTQTMPLAIYLGFESHLDVALTLSVLLMLISFMFLFIVKRFALGRVEEE
jgi:molybdate transport system permease protein